MTLTDDQIRQFETEGHLVVEDALEPHILDSLRTEYAGVLNRLYAGWEAEGRVPSGHGRDFWGKLSAAYAAGCDWFQPMDCSLPGGDIAPDTPFHFGPAAFGMITSPRLLDIVEALIGPEITSNPIQHIRIKPPAADLSPSEGRAHVGLTDWHQDRGVSLPEADATRMVTVWLAITDVPPEAAPLTVIPGAHRDGLIEHCGHAQTGIPRPLLPAAQPRALPCRAGAAVILHPLIPHASLPNRSAQFRWSFDIRYNVTGEPTGRAHFPEFAARSRARPDAALTDWRAWARMWEEARARLAGAPHIPIHRWDTDSPVCA